MSILWSVDGTSLCHFSAFAGMTGEVGRHNGRIVGVRVKILATLTLPPVFGQYFYSDPIYQ